MFTAVFWLCLVSPINGWSADATEGARCVAPQQKGYELSFPTLEQCQFFLNQMKQVSSTRKELDVYSRLMAPGKEEKWYAKGECRVRVIDEFVICQDCDS
jgi:hypothetical protein